MKSLLNINKLTALIDIKYIKYSFLIFIFFLCFYNAYAEVIISVPDNLNSIGTTEVEIPIHISNITKEQIAGYIIRLDYDDVLTNPEIITNGTLSQGLPVESATPIDIYGGKLTIGLMIGLNISNDGILIKIKFKVSDKFIASPIKFITEKTILHTSIFEQIKTSTKDNFLVRTDSTHFNTINFDFNFVNNFSSCIEALSCSQNQEAKLTLYTLTPHDSYIIAGDNNLSINTIIPANEDNIKNMQRKWLILSNNTIPAITLGFNISDTPVNASHYFLLRSFDNINFSEIAQASSINIENKQVIFNIPENTLPNNAYYTLKLKGYSKDTPNIHKSLKADYFKKFIYLLWNCDFEDDLYGFNIWRRKDNEPYFSRITPSIINAKQKYSRYSFQHNDISINSNYIYRLEYIYNNSAQNYFVDVYAKHSKIDINKDYQFNMNDILLLFNKIAN